MSSSTATTDVPAPSRGGFAPTGTRPVRWYNLVAYGANDILGAGSMAVLSSWAILFYTQFCGLEAWQAGLIPMTARLFDAIASPVIGHVSDNFGRTWLGRRFGRRRFFILAAIPLLPSFALMWVTGQSFWYYLITYVLFELVYTMEIIPYETLAAEMAKDFKTKARFAGARILFGQVAAILAAGLPWVLEKLGKHSADTFLYMCIVFTLLFMASAGLLYLFSWERPPAEVAAQGAGATKPSVLAALKALYRNLFSTLRIRAFRLHLGMYLGGYISQDIFNVPFTVFIIFGFGGSVADASTVLVVMFALQLLSVALTIQLATRASPAFAYKLAAGSFALGVITLLWVWWSGVRAGSTVIYLPIALCGLGRGALNYIPWATYNYMADVDEIVTGRRREGAFAGVMTFVRKFAQSGVLAAVPAVMSLGGFVKGTHTQSPAAVNTMAALMGIGTLGMLIFGVLVSMRFKLDPRTHAILMDEIERFRNTPDTPPSDEARAIAEDLSGWPHEKLWGRNPVAQTGASQQGFPVQTKVKS